MMGRRLLLVVVCCLALSPVISLEASAELWEPLYMREKSARGATVDLRAVGDVMLGRRIRAAAAERGWERVFATVGVGGETPFLGGDLTIGNLESPLSEAQVDSSNPLQLIGPPAAAATLSTAGFDLLGLANNHAYDAGADGLAATHATLEMAGISAPGIGVTVGDAVAPVRLTINGLKLAIFAASDVAGRSDPLQGHGGWQRAGLDESFFRSVSSAEETRELAVVLVHWGQEYTDRPTERQRLLAEKLVAAGADLIVGSHPHVLQPYALVEANGRRGVVLYSLGNFLFDQLTRWDTSTGAVARIILDREGVVELGAAPVDLINWQIWPLPNDSYEGQQALRAMGANLVPASQIASHPSLQAWSWDGSAPHPVVVPRRTNPIIHASSLYVDLRGSGEQQLITLDGETVSVYAGTDNETPPVWKSSIYGWPITRIVAGDADNDGRVEVAMLVNKPDQEGVVRVHPFLLGYRGGKYKIIWGGSPRPNTIRDLAIGDLDGDRANELVFLEGPTSAAQPASTIVIFRWDAWFFYEEARLTRGSWYRLEIRDLDRDGTRELLADREAPTGRQ